MSVPLKRNDDSSGVFVKPFKLYDGLYGITPDGRVWSYPKQKRPWGIWLRQAVTSYGYRHVNLRDKHGIRKSWLVHRLVALVFLPQPFDDSFQVNHKNGIKSDNRVENLEWCTGAYNVRHAYANNLVYVKSPARLANSKIVIRLANAARAAKQRSLTHCKHGHELSGENLRLYDGKRQCRACAKRASSEYYQLHKGTL